jgi:hypothetical protein
LTLKTAALCAAGSLVLAGVAFVPHAAASASPSERSSIESVPSAPKYSDDDLMLAVLFGAGPAAQALGIHIADETVVPEDFEALALEVVREFRADRSADADAAVEAFRSGNPIAVHEAARSLQRQFQETYLEAAPRIENGALCAAVNLVLAGNLAVAINVGVAVTIAFVTWVVTYQVENQADAEVISARLSDLGRE